MAGDGGPAPDPVPAAAPVPAAEESSAPNVAQIALAPGTEQAGLALMLAELIRFNLARKPGRWNDFNKLRALISIEARDAQVTATLQFKTGTLVVHGGLYGAPDIRISAESMTVLELAMVKIVRGIPNLLDPDGRKVVGKLLTGGVRISGIVRHPVSLIRMTRLLSVND